MIKIRIIESPDYDSLGEYEFETNSFTIGDKKSNHLVVFDSYLINNIIRFQVKKNSLFISISGDDSFLINNISFKGGKRVKEKDILSFGSTKLVVEKFSNELDENNSLFEHIKTVKNELKNKKYLDLIEEVENQIAKIELENE